MPPFGRLAAVILSGSELKAVTALAEGLARAADPLHAIGADVWGPAPAPIARIRGRHRMRLLIRADRGAPLQDALAAWISPARLKGDLRLAVVPVTDRDEAARRACVMVRAGEGDVVMKGSLETAGFMRAALDREIGLRTGRLFSHVAVFEIPGFNRLLLITDAGVVIAPDIYEKVEIVQNAIDVACKLGIEQPRVAVLAADPVAGIPTYRDMLPGAFANGGKGEPECC